jgi:hypothetical protein
MKSLFTRKTVLLTLGTLSTLLLIAVSPLLIHFGIPDEGCTSWIAMGDALDSELSGKNKVILHKNRDASIAMHPVKVNTGLYRYIGMADTQHDPDHLRVYSGVNEAGLAVANNTGNFINMSGSFSGPVAVREILENCDSVDCAYQWIADNKSGFKLENIMFIATPEKGAVVEIQSGGLWGPIEITSKEDSLFDGDQDAIIAVDSRGASIRDPEGNPLMISGRPGLAFRSNHFLKLHNSWGILQHSRDRCVRLSDLFTKDGGEEGYYGAINLFVSQAIGALAATDGKKDALCRSSTLGRITIEIDSSHLGSLLYHGDGYDPDHCSQTEFSELPKIEFDLDPEAISSYDFVGITPSDAHAKIYACDVDKFPFGGKTSNLNSKVEADVSAYTAVSNPDGDAWTTVDPGGSDWYGYDEMMLWVEMMIDEAPEDIQQVEFIFQGYSSQDNDFIIYVKTASGVWQDDSSWAQLGEVSNFKSNGNDSIRRVLDGTDIGDFIDTNGMITWMVGTPKGRSDFIRADFVKMEVVRKG